MTLFGKPKRRKCAKASKSTLSLPPEQWQPHPPNRLHHPSQSSYNLNSSTDSSPPYPSRPQAVPVPIQWQGTVPYRYQSAPFQSASTAYLPLPPPVPSESNGKRHAPKAPQQPRWMSCTDLTSAVPNFVQPSSDGPNRTKNYVGRQASLCDLIGDKFNDVISLIDEERFSGEERELVVKYEAPLNLRGGGRPAQNVSRSANTAITNAITSTNYFSKANLYVNSRLPPDLPPLRVYIPTYPLLCLAAQYSHSVYSKPSKRERTTHIPSSSRTGTKAMVLKSVPIDDMNTVVLAIRGTQTFMDWAVNLNSTPSCPTGFLDDDGNLCHTGFLTVARKMIAPVAARLRQMLEEQPTRASFSLLLTGHSAGGAVAALLFAHMMATEVKSELNILTGCFKRIHCVTFGAPPITLLPLSKPSSHRLRKSLFLSFINEGDPVPRADKAYVRSLLDLYATPAPGTCLSNLIPNNNTAKLNLLPSLPLVGKKSRPNLQKSATTPVPQQPNLIWKVPPSTLSNAGRLVVLRIPNHKPEEVRACITSDEQLRSVIFGDPLMHMMKVYARRVEVLATLAVTGRLAY